MRLETGFCFILPKRRAVIPGAIPHKKLYTENDRYNRKYFHYVSIFIMTANSKKNSGSKPATPQVWAFTTYFCEGLPYSIIRTVSAVFFRDNGISLQGIGLTSLFGLPWALKFFWAPYLDRYGTKRQWLLIMQLLLAGVFLAAAVLAPLSVAVPLIGMIFFYRKFSGCHPRHRH